MPAGRIVEQGVAVGEIFGELATQFQRMGERRAVLGLEDETAAKEAAKAVIAIGAGTVLGA